MQTCSRRMAATAWATVANPGGEGTIASLVNCGNTYSSQFFVAASEQSGWTPSSHLSVCNTRSATLSGVPSRNNEPWTRCYRDTCSAASVDLSTSSAFVDCYLSDGCISATTASQPSSSAFWVNSSALQTGTVQCSNFSQYHAATASESVALLTAGFAGPIHAEQAVLWHSDLVESVRSWHANAAETSPAVFWSFFDLVDRGYTLPIFPDRGKINLEDWALPGAPTLPDCFSDWYAHRDLSSRNIRLILGTVLQELEAQESVVSATAVIGCIRETLTRGVRVQGKWRVAHACPTTSQGAPSTHEWVLAFIFHTGISPPTWAVARPSVGRALVSMTNAQQVKIQQVKYEPFRRRPNSRDLRNTFRSRRTPARLGRGSPHYASLSSRMQSSGCWRARHNNSLAQCP